MYLILYGRRCYFFVLDFDVYYIDVEIFGNSFDGTKRTDRFVWFLLGVLLGGLFVERCALVVLLNIYQLLPLVWFLFKRED